MTQNSENRYKASRLEAGLTQEQAAEALHVSVRALSDYENGKVRPHDDTVLAMVKAYGCPLLGYEHMYNSNLGKEVLVELEMPETNNCAAMQLLNAKNDLKRLFKSLRKLTLGVAHPDGLSEEARKKVARNLNLIKLARGRIVGAEMYKKKIALNSILPARKEPPSHRRPKRGNG